jgi:hypothetical protein
MIFVLVQRGSSSGSGSGGGGAPSSGTAGAAGPYQTGVYDSWKTEWNPAYRYQLEREECVESRELCIW